MTAINRHDTLASHTLIRTEAREPCVAEDQVLHEHHDPHLAHHFESSKQQYEAAKFGMWLFLATEMLFFGGLFCLYAVYRGNNPDIFAYGAQFLSTTWGAVNTIVLILSSMTMAFAVRSAQLGRKRGLLVALGLTLLGGLIFMGVKTVEYSHKFEHGLVWGIGFYESRTGHAAIAADDDVSHTPGVILGDATAGRALWMGTCLACHGDRGQGMPGQAFDIRGDEFITSKTDQELVNFIKQGRMPFDPLNRTGIQMPPRGGNPMLKDGDLLNIVAYIRTFEAPADAPDGADAVDGVESDSDAVKMDITALRSSIPRPTIGPRGLAAPPDDGPTRDGPPDPRTDPDRPINAHMFFNIYFLMTGLHGIHVLVGMGVIGFLIVMATRGAYSAAYFTPVELTGLYWHLVDLIWIFLFPLFYLIH